MNRLKPAQMEAGPRYQACLEPLLFLHSVILVAATLFSAPMVVTSGEARTRQEAGLRFAIRVRCRDVNITVSLLVSHLRLIMKEVSQVTRGVVHLYIPR